MAKEKAKIPGYKIVVNGEYYHKDANGNKSIKFYGDKTFYLPEIVSYREGRKEVKKMVGDREIKTTEPNIIRGNSSRVGLHIIRRYYIEAQLKEDIPECVGVRTCNIFSKERVLIDPPKELKPENIQKMTKSELRQFVTNADINIELSSYGDFGDQKNAVIRAYQQKVKDDTLAGKTAAMSKAEANLLPAEGIEEGPATSISGDLFS